MKKIKLHYLVGNVHLGGHDIQRVAKNNRLMLEKAGCFDVLMVSYNPELADITFGCYFDGKYMEECEVFVFDCGGIPYFNEKEGQERFERVISAGAGCVFLHGTQVCYWKDVGMAAWDEMEKMAGLLWRNSTQHGDYSDTHVTIWKREHPIMQGMTDFDTTDELFCRCENVYQVPLEVLATAYSDPEVISRHGLRGTGKEEPIAVTGMYGKGRIFNQFLGHVWPYYTGHGLGENTMLSFQPVQFRQMFVRACEWAATGKVERTLDFDGKVKLV